MRQTPATKTGQARKQHNCIVGQRTSLKPTEELSTDNNQNREKKTNEHLRGSILVLQNPMANRTVDATSQD
jgi:hypothetical protein